MVYSCASPISPTGGPPDEEGPHIVSTEPETGTTNFGGQSITFHFSEFINRGSVTEAVVVEPGIGIPYELDWGRKSLAVEFEEELPDSTTLIVTLGTDLTDMNNNKLAVPYKVAVSTGPEIDEGEIVGRVLDAKTGEGTEGYKILLYRQPVDLSTQASYSAETDTSGAFRFSYLSEGDYKAFWVDDRNRNKTWNPELERAQPFSREIISLEKAGKDTLEALYIAQSDTSKPVFQGVGLFSGRRLRLRFSENIELLDSTRIVINDTLGNRYSGAYPLYVSPSDPYVLFVQSEKSLAPEQSYEIVLNNIADTFGNIQPLSSQSFTGSVQDDTTAQRTIKRLPESGLFPTESMEVIYAAPVTGQAIRDSLKIIAGTELVKNPGQYAGVRRNRLIISPSGQWKDGLEYEFRVWAPLQNTHKNVRPIIWYQQDLGSLNIQLEDTSATDTTGTFHLILQSEERGVMADTTFSGQVEITNLPALVYQAIIFEDLNGNDNWDHGRVEPYEPPEPYLIRSNIPVEESFTSDLTVSFDE